MIKPRNVRFIISFSVPLDDRWVIERIDALARMEKGERGRSYVILKLLKESLKRYEEPPQTRIVIDPKRVDAAICFLRSQCRLSIRTISKVVNKSKSYVHEVCRRNQIDIRAVRVKNFPLEAYRKRFKVFMNRPGVPPAKVFDFSKSINEIKTTIRLKAMEEILHFNEMREMSTESSINVHKPSSLSQSNTSGRSPLKLPPSRKTCERDIGR